MNNNVLFEIKELHQLIINLISKDKNIGFRPTATQVRFIDYLTKNKNVQASDLEKFFHISKATVSDVLNTMEKHKIITRVVSDMDTRSKIILLNDEYKRKHHAFQKKMYNLEKEITKNLTEEELNSFINTLTKMKTNINNSLICDRRNIND